MPDYTLEQIVMRLAAFGLFLAVHGAAVAGAAVLLGDPGPRQDGRLSLNPLVHLDLLGTLSGVLYSAGWGAPIAVDPGKLRGGRLALVGVVAAGVAASVLSVALLAVLRPLVLPLMSDTGAATFFAFVEVYREIGLACALLNLLPLPCFTGGHLLVALMPARRQDLTRLALPCGLLMTLLAASGWVGSLLRALIEKWGQ
jgi:Zn-dependent protease